MGRFSAARAASPAVPALTRRPGAPRRLELAETLLGATEASGCARLALEWLRRHARVRRGVCLVVEGDEPLTLAPVATLGLNGGKAPTTFVLDRRDHPLFRVIVAMSPAVLPGRGHERPPTPLGAVDAHAVPLPGPDPRSDRPVGLLLLAPVVAAAEPDLTWLAGLLGPRLAALRRTAGLGATVERLDRERGLFHAILNAVTDPILLTDPDGRIVAANARAEALLAASDDESEGRRRAVALNNMLFSAALSRKAIEEVEPWRHELLLVDPTDGSDLLFELLGTATSHPREGTAVVSILRNVTDLHRATEQIEEQYRKLRQAETEVRAERDRLDVIIDSVADPIVVTDPSGDIVMMNAPAERLFTFDPARSAPDAQRLVQANDAHFSSFISNLFFGEALRRSGTINLVDPATGSALPVEAVSGKIVSEHGEVSAVVTVLHDRTEELERARLYEELKRASAQLEQKVREATAELVHQNELLRRSHIALEQASAAKSQFLANMSHEFRTPLNAILGYTSILLRGVGGELAGLQRQNLERIESNAQHLFSMINDILDISRIEAGKMPLTVGEFALPELIEEVLTEVEPLIARTRLAVDCEMVEPLPPVTSDRTKIKQIVINLLTNALKFTPQGVVRVRTSHDPIADTMAIAVEDTGIGIAQADLDVIFEDFRQADTSPSRQYSGAGLGLAICRRLASMLDGRLTVTSKPGEGSTFTLLTPRTLTTA